MSGRFPPVRLGPLLVLAALAACGDSQPGTTAGAANASGPAAAVTGEAPKPAAASLVAAAAAASPAKPGAGPDMAGRSGELLNPDDASMVFLYQDLAGLTPQFDQWVENDNRVRSSDPRDRAALRETVKAELQGAAASVSDVGFIRLSLQSAKLSRYDPNYGEFTVGALAPSSVIEYKAFGQKVNLKFANGRTAQLWKVPPEQAQVIDDKLASYRNPKLEVLVQIKSVVPGPGGGSIMADVVEFDLRDDRDDSTIGRVKLQP